MIEVFAVCDIDCGEKITPDMVIETSPAQIVIREGSRIWYPMNPVWQQNGIHMPYESYTRTHFKNSYPR